MVNTNNITFLSFLSILFIFLFSIIDNDIITVHSSVENTQTITNSTQSDRNSNLTTVQWQKFVNETIGIRDLNQENTNTKNT